MSRLPCTHTLPDPRERKGPALTHHPRANCRRISVLPFFRTTAFAKELRELKNKET
jgi:hypothetical protein